jgi:hypothetical protein
MDLCGHLHPSLIRFPCHHGVGDAQYLWWWCVVAINSPFFRVITVDLELVSAAWWLLALSDQADWGFLTFSCTDLCNITIIHKVNFRVLWLFMSEYSTKLQISSSISKVKLPRLSASSVRNTENYWLLPQRRGRSIGGSKNRSSEKWKHGLKSVLMGVIGQGSYGTRIDSLIYKALLRCFLLAIN